MPIGKEPIVLFGGGTDGGGDAVNIGRDSYHWTINWDCRPFGRSVPAMAPTGHAGKFFGPIVAAFEWETNDTPPRPILLIPWGAGTNEADVTKLTDNTITEQDDTRSQDRYTDGVLYRSGDTEIAYFCNGSANNALVNRTKAASYAQTGDAKADRLSQIGQDLWRAQGYNLSKLTLDADPITESNWGANIPCGIPTWSVNEIVPLGGSPIALKPEGVLKYNAAPSSAVFENITPFVNAHPDNGKGGFVDGRGRVYYPTADGHILVITFGFQQSQTPTDFHWIDRDTPWGRITAFTADIDHIYAAVQPGHIRTDQLNMQVWLNDGGTFYNVTTSLTDNKWSTDDTTDTPGSLAALTSGGTDFIYVGADEPFWGVWWDVLTERTAGGATWSSISYSDGNDSWAAFGGNDTHDSTNIFSKSGCFSFTPTTDVVASGAWIKSTVTGMSGSPNKYWVRFPVPTALTGLTVRGVKICPYRPPIDADTFPLTGPALAGVLPKILVGTWRGEKVVWHDVWTLASAEIEQLVVGRTTSTHSVGDRTLYAITSGMGDSRNIWYMAVGPEADTSRAVWPKLADYGDSEFSMDEHVITFSGHTFGMPHVPKEVKGRVTISMKHVQDDDEVYFVYWWDEDSERYYRKGPLAQDELVIEGLEGSGQTLYSALIIKDGSRDAIAPTLPTVIIEAGGWEWFPADEQPTREGIASPMNR